MNDYEIKETDEYRIREIVCILPFIYNFYIGKWFRKLKVKEKKFEYRIKKFSEFNYQFYWSAWHEKWKIVEIIDKSNKLSITDINKIIKNNWHIIAFIFLIMIILFSFVYIIISIK
jgi:hypothetical protein